MFTDPEHIDAFRLQCGDFCDIFEDAFQFSPDGDLLCDRVNRAAAEMLTSNPRVRFLIELVTGVSVDKVEFVEPTEGEAEHANAENNVILTRCYGLLYTFYCRMCQADRRQQMLERYTPPSPTRPLRGRPRKNDPQTIPKVTPVRKDAAGKLHFP